MAKIVLLTIILCVASVSCVELENLCSSDAFKYEGVLVNAFHRVQQNVTFPSLSYYLVSDTVKCDFFQFKNKTKFWEAIKLKQRYNLKIGAWYTEDLIGQTAKDDLIKKKILYKQVVEPLFDIINDPGKTETNTQCLEVFGEKVRSGCALLDNLVAVFFKNGHPNWDMADLTPTNDESIQMLKKLMRELKNSADGQTFAFDENSLTSDPFKVFYHKPVVLPKELKFLKEHDSDRVGLETKSMLVYEQIMPFNNQNHKDADCVPAKELPLFYTKKGKGDIN